MSPVNQEVKATESDKYNTYRNELPSRRRHFRDDYKKKVVADVLSGKVDIENVKDSGGKKISKYLVQRWKAEFRGHKFAAEALMQGRGTFTSPIKPELEGPSTDDLQKEIVRLSIENRKLREILSIDLDPIMASIATRSKGI